MAKITRKTQKVFGENAGGTGITEYGSPAAGSPVYSTDPDDIQTSDWLTGWSAAALAGTEIPTFQDFNAIHFVQTRQIGYLLQEGIPEYDSGTEYHTNSIVKKSGTYELYGSKINNNTGNALPVQVDDANWEYLGSLTELGTIPDGSITTAKLADDAVTTAKLADEANPFGKQLLHVQDQKTPGTNGGASVAGVNIRDLNTVLTNEITGSSLATDQITLPAGTYYIEASAPVYRVMRHMLRLYNVTDTSFVTSVDGTSGFVNDTSTANVRAFLSGRFTIASGKDFEIRHIIEDAISTNGLGVSVGGALTIDHETYSDVKIWKVG